MAHGAIGESATGRGLHGSETPAFAGAPLELAVVVPTLNERRNVEELVTRLRRVLTGVAWEVIFVDDDSVDGTGEVLERMAQLDRRVRVLRRIGRRGLSSACMEGVYATSAPFVAVMDADLQHDEQILPVMYARLRAEGFDVVVGTRNACGGSMGDFSARRRRMSEAGRRISNLVCRCTLTDPMSGFFVLDRTFFLRTSRQMYGGGFKFLVDLLASSETLPHVGEVGYRFRLRQHGDSKLDVNTTAEYLLLVLHKLTRGWISPRFMAFAFVGSAGVLTHLAILTALMRLAGMHFLPAQIAASLVAMTENFLINNLVTFHDARLRGFRLWIGWVSFVLVCSVGGTANLLVAETVLGKTGSWFISGLVGTGIGSLWNFSMSSLFTWKQRRGGLGSPAEKVALPGEAGLRA